MLKQRLNLQMFANIEDIIENNKEAFEGMEVTETLQPIADKLNELGFEILINNKQKAEFIPATRLSEVITQRDTFKEKVEELNDILGGLKEKAGDNQQLKDDYQNVINKNNQLLQDLETTRINAEIIAFASTKNAINPKDIIAFINYDNIKVTPKGEVLGIESEVNRIQESKAYLFHSDKNPRQFGAGHDGQSGQDGDSRTSGMNAMIRKAAGRLF